MSVCKLFKINPITFYILPVFQFKTLNCSMNISDSLNQLNIIDKVGDF